MNDRFKIMEHWNDLRLKVSKRIESVILGGHCRSGGLFDCFINYKAFQKTYVAWDPDEDNMRVDRTEK